jgi:hypothetical protein
MSERVPPRLPVAIRNLGTGHVAVWCEWCCELHWHGGTGHRVAHCDRKTPYTETGYIVVDTAQEPAAEGAA